ncbi:MAG: hypothetical protein E7256_14385 [Lachnospiraceae bacterium]|nr:hypothetical protein [Lachnospiraceae bacterium]
MARRNKYVKDYETREQEGGKGKTIIYTGKYYKMDVSEDKRKVVGICYLGFQIAFLTVFGLMGLLNTESSRKVYVVLPYMFLFLPIYYGLLGTVKLFRTKAEMTFAEYDQSVLRIRKSAIGMVSLAVAVVVGEVVYLVSNHVTNMASLEYRFLMGAVFLAVASFLFLQVQSKYKCVEQN